MVTIRRNATTEEERYGGYKTKFNSLMSDYQNYRNTFDYSDLDERDEVDTRYTDTSEEYNTYLWRELNRTSPRRILTPEELCGGASIPTPEVSGTYAEPIYSPQYVEPAPYVQPKTKTKKASLNFRAKALIVVYALVMVVFVGFICANAGAISTLNAEITTLEQTVATESAQLENVRNDIITDEQVLNMAEGLGYSNLSASGSYQLLDTTKYQGEIVQTNWFDGFCDFVSGIFGG